MHLGQLSTNDSWSPRASEHGGEERMGLSSSVFEIYVREGGHVLAKIAGHTLKQMIVDVKKAYTSRIMIL